MRALYWVLVAGFSAIAIAFALQNLESVTISFFGLSATAPLAATILAIYILGMFTGGGVVSFLRHSIHKATAAPRSDRREISGQS